MVVERKDAKPASKPVKLAKFVPFTELSMQKIADRIAVDRAREQDARSRCKPGQKTVCADEGRRKEKPNIAFVAGKQFPEQFGIFPPELYGKPIEDLDDYYKNKYVSIFSV